MNTNSFSLQLFASAVSESAQAGSPAAAADTTASDEATEGTMTSEKSSGKNMNGPKSASVQQAPHGKKDRRPESGKLQEKDAEIENGENAETPNGRTADSGETSDSLSGAGRAHGESVQNGGSVTPQPEKNAQKDGEEVSEQSKDGQKLLSSVRDAFEERIKNARVKQVTDAWQREEAETKEIYPDFSLADEMRGSELFSTLLKSGVGVRRAYECVHLSEILGSAIRYAVASTGHKMAGAVQNTPVRPGENSVLDRASSVRRTDVNSLTEKDIMRILGEVSKGAKISFK